MSIPSWLSTDGMPENADLLENEYQKLLRILSDEYTGAQSRAATRQKNMQEYYAMWVHQVKTPIAALRLLLQNKNDEGQMTEELSELFGLNSMWRWHCSISVLIRKRRILYLRRPI